MPTTSDSPGLSEEIDVTVVNVDVLVLDRAGLSIAGLRAQDFQLFEDGEKVPITNFSAAEKAPPQAQDSRETLGPVEEAARSGLRVVVFVDDANMVPFNRNRTLKQVRQFLQETLRAQDRVLVVEHNFGLEVRHGFADPIARLDADLEAMSKRTGSGINASLDARQTLESMEELGCERFEDARALARSHAQAELARAKEGYASLRSVVASLGSLDGRRILLYVGNGLPTQVGTDVFGALEEQCSGTSVTLQTDLLNTASEQGQVIAAANANLVTIYSLDAGGLQAYGGSDVARPVMSAQVSQQVTADRQSSLTNLATATGGRAALNGNDYSRDLKRIGRDMVVGYSLGFVPTHHGDGKAHELKVTVRREGAVAYYRQSYRDRSPAEKLEGELQAALIHDKSDNPLLASLKIGGGKKSDHGRVVISVALRVPFSKLSWIPQEDGARHGGISALIVTMDSRGSSSPIAPIVLPLRVPDEDAPRILASQMAYEMKMLVEPGRLRLAVAVRDKVSHEVSTLVQEMSVEKNGSVTLATNTARH